MQLRPISALLAGVLVGCGMCFGQNMPQGQDAPQTAMIAAIQTNNGHYLTVVNDAALNF
jgi:hypothetical protein